MAKGRQHRARVDKKQKASRESRLNIGKGKKKGAVPEDAWYGSK